MESYALFSGYYFYKSGGAIIPDLKFGDNFHEKIKYKLDMGKYSWMLFVVVIILNSGCTFPGKMGKGGMYRIKNHEVLVDGNSVEWGAGDWNTVHTADNLWIGQGILAENWKGEDDLNFRWKACWHGSKIYFLVEVTDDVLVNPAIQTNSFLNDCLEIMFDPANQGGPRFVDTGKGKILNGYEMHFLPASPNHVFLNDSLAPMYPMELAQDSLFRNGWKGKIACTEKAGSYLLELGFEVPGFMPHSGRVAGLDVAVCDDDGHSRKNLMIWSGTKKEFWLFMDDYPKVIFE